MCDAMAVGLGAKGIGTVLAGTAAAERGRANKSRNELSAEVADQAAADAVYSGHLKEIQVGLRDSAAVAGGRVARSATGADAGVGTLPGEALSAVDTALVRRNAALEAYGLSGHARALRQRGADEEQAGQNEMVGTFLSGFGDIAAKGEELKLERADSES